MADQGGVSGGSPYDDNGFEKVQHADISPSAGNPPGSYGGVQDLYGGAVSGDSEPQTKSFAPGPSPTQSSFVISSGVSTPPAVSASGSASSLTPSSNVSLSTGTSGGSVASSASKPEESKPAGGCCCAWIKNVDPKLLELIYWQDIKKTGAVFGSALILLLSLALFSVLSVIAYLSLIILTITLTFRLYKNVMTAVQKTGEGHPFKQYLEMDISLPDDKIHQCAEKLVKTLSGGCAELRRLFLIEDMVDSLKFGLLLWVLTYIGAWFNGMTLIILAMVGIFTLPKVYKVYQVQIDQHVELARTKIHAVIKQVQEKLPLPGKKKQA